MEVSDFHTIINHFTLGLVNAGILFDLIGAISKSEGMKRFGWSAIRLGFAFCIVSLLTGFLSEGSVQIPNEAQSITSYHKVLAFLSAGLLLLGILLRVGSKAKFEDVNKGAAIRGAYLALMALSLVITTVTGVLGSQLVRHFGVSVKPMEEIRNYLPNRTPMEDLQRSH